MRKQVPGATVLTDAASLDGLQARFDAAIVDGLLEDETWDRWLLQRVHRALRPHAPVLVVVPPVTSVASAIDFRFLFYAARRLLQRWWPALEPTGSVRRRYQLAALMRKMESLGYAGLHAGPGWPGTDPAPWLARRSTLTAHKSGSLAGRQGRSWPDARAHLQWYAKRYAAGYGDALAGIFIGNAILPSLLKQDPRYFYKGTGTTRSRIMYALASPVICKGDNKRWQPNYSFIGGSIAVGGISNLYVPAHDRNGAGLVFQNALIRIGQGSLGGIFQEFVFRRLTHRRSQ